MATTNKDRAIEFRRVTIEMARGRRWKSDCESREDFDDRWDRPENRWAPRGTRTDRERLAARVLVHARSCRCYACDGVAVGTRDRRPEGGSLETACARHAEVAS